MALFLKKNLKKFFSLFAFVIILIVSYGTYSVNPPIINLKIALRKAQEAQTLEELQKIKSLLKAPLLKEISKNSTSAVVLLFIETAENIISTAVAMEQVEDIKFFLNGAVTVLQRQRPEFLAALDSLNSRIFSSSVDLPESALRREERMLLSRIKSAQAKEGVQELNYGLGNIYIQLNDISKAKEAFLKAAEIAPKSHLAQKALFNLAWAHKFIGRYDLAKTYFEEIIKESSGQDLSIISEYEIADSLYKEKAYKEAVSKYAQLASRYSEFDASDLCLFAAGYISFYNLNDRQAALEYFAKSEERFPNAKIIRHILTKVRPAFAHDFNSAGYGLLKEKKDVEKEGLAEREGKKYAQAVENFRKAVEIASGDGRAYSGLSLSLYWLKDTDEAMTQAKKAIEVSGQDEMVFINAMFVFINSGKLEEAIAIGQDFLSRAKSAKRPEFYYNLGYAHTLKGSMDEATAYFDSALKLNQDFIFAYNNLGCVFWSIKKYAEAIKMFKEGIARNPAYADAHFNLGVVYMSLNQMEDALAEFEYVLEIDPGYKGAEEFLKHVKKNLRYEP